MAASIISGSSHVTEPRDETKREPAELKQDFPTTPPTAPECHSTPWQS
jgi:hypothetical protein